VTDGWIASVDGTDIPVRSLAHLRSVLADTAEHPYREVQLTSPAGPSLFMLRSHDRALLMFLREGGDAGFTSRADGAVPGPERREFLLSNGQRDEYPASWTVSVARAHEAFEHFFETGERPPFVLWHDDGAG
jgi:hypothetical protein